MKAADIMISSVITVGPEALLRDVATTLSEHHISAVPVVDEMGQLAGIVSEGDLLRRHETGTDKKRSWWLEVFVDADSLAREYVKSHGLRAKDVMTKDVIGVGPDASLADIAGLLEKHRIKRVPVVRDGKLLGIVSRADLVRAFARATAAQVIEQAPATDADLSREFEERLKHAEWAKSLYVQNAVQNGCIQLFGLVRSQAQRDGLVTLAETIPGVRGVEDNLQIRTVLVD